jgi:hypothetical protein
MQKCCLLVVLALCANFCRVSGQNSTKTRFRLGASIAFGLTKISHNEVGLGGVAAVERNFSKLFAWELEGSYNYFTGDKTLYLEGENKAWAIPLLAGIKLYPRRWLYGSLRAGAILFQLNHQATSHIRAAYGFAAGMNLPDKNNRLNIQLGYTGFAYRGDSPGYVTLAAAIIIN